jgi:hypothetical protein
MFRRKNMLSWLVEGNLRKYGGSFGIYPRAALVFLADSSVVGLGNQRVNSVIF